MKRIIFVVCILLIVGYSWNIDAQEQDSKAVLMNAKRIIAAAVNKADRDLFIQARYLLQPLKKNEELSALAYYYLGYIDYQVAVAVERLKEDRAADFIDSCIDNLDTAIAKNESFAEAYALKSSCYGIKISFAPLKGIILGPKASNLTSKAKELAPENPRVALIDAIGTYSTPSLFGGGKDKGLEKMKHAAELFERWEDADSLQPDWGKEEVYAWIGNAYLKRGETILARKAYEKALEINPNYGWVKNKLLPKVTNKPAAKE